MKRIIMMLTVALVMAAIMALTVSSAFADIRCSKQKGVTTCQHGNAGKITEQHHGAPGSNGSAV
jgi:hypothetical protein